VAIVNTFYVPYTSVAVNIQEVFYIILISVTEVGHDPWSINEGMNVQAKFKEQLVTG